MENLIHLFLHYKFPSEIWYKVFRWLGLISLVPPDLYLLSIAYRGGYVQNKHLWPDAYLTSNPVVYLVEDVVDKI